MKGLHIGAKVGAPTLCLLFGALAACDVGDAPDLDPTDAEPGDARSDGAMPADAGPTDQRLPFADLDPVDAADAAPEPGPGCADLARPETLDTPTFVDRGPCPAGHVVRLDAPSGRHLTARLVPLDPGDDPAAETVVELWWPDRGAWIRADRHLLDETVELEWIAPLEGAALRVVGPARWRLAVDETEVPNRQIVIDGHVDTWSRPVTAQGLGQVQPFPALGARIDLIDPDGRLLDVTRAAERGAFTLVADAPDGPAVVRMVAETVVEGIPVRVGPDGELPWAAAITEVRASSTVDLLVRQDEPLVPAWFVARTAADALDRLRRWLPAARIDRAPPVRIRWRPGFSEACGSCFRPGPAPLIDLGGRLSDPDEWDRAVIAHEMGHYVAAVFSRDDSGGGPHDGSPIAPAIAWSEGLATFFGSWPDTPLQFDYKLAGVAQLDLEQMDQPAAFGTVDGTVQGDLSERLVAAVLWDMHDGGEGDDDRLHLPPARLFDPLFITLAGMWTDRGAPGIDLLDYLAAVWCDDPVDGLQDVLDSRDLPHVLRCKGGGPLHSRPLPDGRVELWSTVAGTLNLGQRRQALQAGQRIIMRPPAGALGATLDHPAGRAVVTFVDPRPARLPRMRRAGAWEVQR